MISIHKLSARYPYLLSLATGALSALGFAPLNWWPLTLLSFAVWMTVIYRLEQRRSVAVAGWLFGLGHFVVGLNWIAKAFTFQSAMPEWLGYIAVVALSLYLAIYPALAAFGAWLSGKNRPVVFILAFAGFWIVTEWIRSWAFSGFIWNPLAVVSVPLGLFPAASTWIGTYGLSGLVILSIGGIWLLVEKRWKVALPIIILTGISSILPKTADQSDPEGQPKIIVVQPNIGQQDKWKAGYEEENLSKLARLTLRKDAQPHILFWPEAAIPDYLETGYPRRYYYNRPPDFVRRQLASLMRPGDMLLLGGLKLEFDNAGERAIGARNSVFAVNSERELVGRYDKNHLVPYGEYLPMRPLLTVFGLSRLVPGDFDFWPGPGAQSLELGEFGKAGMQVCYEIIFSGQVVDRENRPDFIFNPSNDAWFGAWGPPQHLAQAQLRAIEEGLPVIRSTPTGVSAVIGANGVVHNSVPMGEAGRIDTILPRSKPPTLFASHGNILPIGLALFLLICAIAIRQRDR